MGTRLYVGNLPVSADEEQVRDLNGRDYGGRPLTVNEARERTSRGGVGGGKRRY